MEKRQGKGLAEFLSTRRGKCVDVKRLLTWTQEERDQLLSDFNLMGAYLW